MSVQFRNFGLQLLQVLIEFLDLVNPLERVGVPLLLRHGSWLKADLLVEVGLRQQRFLLDKVGLRGRAHQLLVGSLVGVLS